MLWGHRLMIGERGIAAATSPSILLEVIEYLVVQPFVPLVISVLQVDPPAHRPHQRLRGDLPVDKGGSSPGPRQGAHQVSPGYHFWSTHCWSNPRLIKSLVGRILNPSKVELIKLKEVNT